MDQKAATRIQGYQDKVDQAKQVVGKPMGEDVPELKMGDTPQQPSGMARPVTQQMSDASTPLTKAADAIENVGKETTGMGEDYTPVVSELRHLVKPSTDVISEGVAALDKAVYSNPDSMPVTEDEAQAMLYALMEGVDYATMGVAGAGGITKKAFQAMGKSFPNPSQGAVGKIVRAVAGKDPIKGDACYGDVCRALKTAGPDAEVKVLDGGKHVILIEDGKIISDNPMGTYNADTGVFTSDGSSAFKGAKFETTDSVSAKELDSLGTDYAESFEPKPPLNPRLDMGHGRWLENKKMEVDAGGRAETVGWGTEVPEGQRPYYVWGSPTAGLPGQTASVPIEKFDEILGESGEQLNVRDEAIDWLRKNMEVVNGDIYVDGLRYDPFIRVDKDGVPWVNEGNHRLLVAKEKGADHVNVEISWFTGGNEVKDHGWDLDSIIKDHDKINNITESPAQVEAVTKKAEGGKVRDMKAKEKDYTKSNMKKYEPGLYKDDAGQYWKVDDKGEIGAYSFD